MQIYILLIVIPTIIKPISKPLININKMHLTWKGVTNRERSFIHGSLLRLSRRSMTVISDKIRNVS